MSTILPIPFSPLGFIYQAALDALRLAADTAESALASQLAAKRAELAAYNAGTVFIGERDADGYRIWEQDQVLEIAIERLAEALLEVRRTFVISAYHHWEVSVVSWARHADPTAKDPGHHDQLVAKAADLGYPADPELCKVRRLANLFKHDSSTARAALEQAVPDHYKAAFANDATRPFWASGARVAPETLNWVFDVVRYSGPFAHGGSRRRATATLSPSGGA
ncbi:hypothetical protein HLH33_15705 [Gluconacetobacter diazotrophicus]|uniref:Uncharacterized protein n=1 Tax=Gluconacetobacter diazotrophicus TaxID=33996 RepID=A0A7W4I7J3_GLUDI|nr:hypothetical protein [Gluconacetobacter diazotrophicus]MBB2157734.1 hypothetical protein [Gluconacetobacter diazotrophicus]